MPKPVRINSAIHVAHCALSTRLPDYSPRNNGIVLLQLRIEKTVDEPGLGNSLPTESLFDIYFDSTDAYCMSEQNENAPVFLVPNVVEEKREA
jgi:hypothetical protein